MSEQTPDRRHGSPAQLALLAFGGLVLYILSPGPVTWVVLRTNATWIMPIVSSVYYPLGLMADRVPLVQAFYETYFTLLGII